jgi:hypothetical protein
MSMKTIQTGLCDTCFTIAFQNNALGGSVHVWVCSTYDMLLEEVEKLKALKHIKILQAGNAVVKEVL